MARITISLPHELYRQLKAAARRRGMSMAAIVRDAIIRDLADEDPGRIAAQRARAGIGLSRAYDNPDEFVADLHRATKKRKPFKDLRK